MTNLNVHPEQINCSSIGFFHKLFSQAFVTSILAQSTIQSWSDIQGVLAQQEANFIKRREAFTYETNNCLDFVALQSLQK